MCLKLEKISETLSIYQTEGVFSYGTDAVLLAAYTKGFVKKLDGKIACDLCTGTGIVPLLLLDKTESFLCHGIEINQDAIRLCEMSAKENALESRFFPVLGDIKNSTALLPPDTFDFVTCNPPYMTGNCGFLCEKDYKTIARHEILCDIGDVFSAAFRLLKTGSDLFIVYRPDRLSSLFSAAEKNNFSIKNMTFVHARIEKEPVLLLCRAKKQAKEGLIVSKPFLIYRENGEYTDEMKSVSKGGSLFGA